MSGPSSLDDAEPAARPRNESEIVGLRAMLATAEHSSWRLAFEVSRLIHELGVISSRHPAADALLDWADERGIALPMESPTPPRDQTRA